MPTGIVKFNNKYKHKKTKWVSNGILKSIKFRDWIYKKLRMTKSAGYLTININLKTYNNILMTATDRPCITALPSNSWQLKDASTHVAFLWITLWFRATRCISDQLGALGVGRKHIYFHVNRRLKAGVEHALLEQLVFFFECKHCFR